ncbi:MAG: hypothetical protein OCD02_08715 [Spirochaetaceae bacterium]
MKTTTLYNRHKELNATFSEFGGYNMPLWYGSAKEEHISVIKSVGLFDTSHMSVFTITGRDSLNLLKRAFSRDIDELKIGKSVYGLFQNSELGVIDDTLIYHLENLSYMVVVNAGMSEIIISHLLSFKFNDIKIDNYTDKLAKIDIQGPKSIKIMEKLFDSTLFDLFPYFSFKGNFIDSEIKFNNQPILISRSGYTGEFGFELYVDSKCASDLWDSLLLNGEEFDIIPCGLAARDSLRVGAGLPLSHQDIGNWKFCNNPWNFAVTNSVKSSDSYTYAYVGYDVRKLHAEKTGNVIYQSDSIGEVLTCISEVSLTRIQDTVLSVNSPDLPHDYKIKGLVAGFIKVNRPLDYNTIIFITDGKRELKVEVVESIRPHRTARKSIKNIRSFK